MMEISAPTLCKPSTAIFGWLLISSYILRTADAIDCFKCVSVNWDNRQCDDPFHNNYSLGIYESPCMGGRKDRNGLFPATACIKISGVFADNGTHLTVRGCALDSGTLTTDTEIIRMSHCGGLNYDNRYLRGCLQSCNDADGCNHSPSIRIPSVFFSLISTLILIAFNVIIK